MTMKAHQLWFGLALIALPLFSCNLGDDPATTPDVVCEVDSCHEHGECSVEGEDILCACEEGWAGDRCEECADGYRTFDNSDDCVEDLCVADPCGDIPHGVPGSCVMPGAEFFTCECGAGHEWNGDSYECLAFCIDPDMDQYGEGAACLGPDCIEGNEMVHSAAQVDVLNLIFGEPDALNSVVIARSEKLHITADVVITRNNDCLNCTHKVMLAYYSPELHYMPMGCLVAEAGPLACEAGGSIYHVDTDQYVPATPGEYEIRMFKVTDDEPNCGVMADTLVRASDPNLGEVVGTVQTEEVACYLNSQVLDNIRFNDDPIPTRRFTTPAGEPFNITIGWQHSKGNCGGCIVPLAVGFYKQNETKQCLYSGVPSSCDAAGNYVTKGTGTLTFPAPEEPGVYQMRWHTAAVYGCDVNINGAPFYNAFAVVDVVP